MKKVNTKPARGGTWSMLSGMNSPSLLMLVKEPFLATCCRASGM